MSADRPAPDRNSWTADYASSNGATAPAPSPGPGRLVVLGYITAFALPLLGLLLGIVIATRRTPSTSRHGRWIIGVSIVASVIWVLAFTSGVLTSTNNDMGY